MSLKALYRHSLTLLTDLYQLTMAQGYWKLGMAERRAAFHLFFRRAPFKGDWALTCGLGSAVEYLSDLGFDDSDVAYLATLTGNDGKALFEPGFLAYLREMEFSCDVDAVAEGEVMYGNEPLIRVVGPVLQAQLVETPLLNLVNFQTLVATKSARICAAAQGEPVLEFGLRRAQGPDGGIHGARAAYVGGAAATSNVLAGKMFGIPVKGTHAHSWVMCFDSETEAFESYARALPNNCVFLVDTYHTVEGVERAIAVGCDLKARGYRMMGIRLDSGDLAALSIAARKLLDDAGFEDAAIVASNDLDEYRIAELKAAGATIAVWGVGTRLATCWDQPALGGVYKLGGIQDEEGVWKPRMKLSNEPIKQSNPGCLQVRRTDDGDVIWETEILNRPPDKPGRDLLQPVIRGGKALGPMPSLAETRALAMANVATAGPRNVSLEPTLQALKDELSASLREAGR